jgi:hypothetical protein
MTTSSAHPRLMNGAAWNDFCDEMKRLGDQILRPETPADPASRAEGFRHPTHVLRSALDIFVDHADPDFPVFYRVCDEIVKYGGDNPDNYYQKCVVRFIEGSATLFCDWSQDYQKATNRLPKADQELCRRVGGDPNICYYNGYWEIEPGEALVVVLPRIPECESWNLQLCNYWMESLDYRYETIHINKFTARPEPDGSVRSVIAHRDPGIPNWLSTTGHRVGTTFFRWIGAKEHVDRQTRLVELDALR